MGVFIGGAWPYANGSLHLGHIASLLPGDILARYYRMKDEEVLYVSGSDCNGTPIAIKAKQEGVTPKEISDHFHKEFEECFLKLGFTYDCYTRTDTVNHHKTVQGIFLTLLENGYLYKKEIEQTYCDSCELFLPDRYVEGKCPHCGQSARGDQCDACSNILDPIELLEKSCKLCGKTPSIQKTEHFYFALSSFQSVLERIVKQAKISGKWRHNAIQLTERYLNEGLQDRTASRDLLNGVSIPVKGYEEKKVYVWIEAVSGYYSASKQWAAEHDQNENNFWKEGTKAYYVHGKDNIPFHTIIWPAIISGTELKGLPTHIISNEYLTVEKKKLSTSRNWAVWIPDIVERYHPDSIRYFLTINAPENRDTDFSWREFIYSHNSELLGAYGNFINRTLKFIEKNYQTIPKGTIDEEIKASIIELYERTGKNIEAGHFKQALEEIFTFVRYANKYFDEREPWKDIKNNPESCKNTISNCVLIIANLIQLLSPFLPFSSEEVKELLGLRELKWRFIQLENAQINNVNPLFERIDVKQIEEELAKLNQAAK